jgi:hypothetical protein
MLSLPNLEICAQHPVEKFENDATSNIIPVLHFQIFKFITPFG